MKHPFLRPLYRAMIILLLTNSFVFSQWASQNSGSEYPLSSVYFINTQTGFVGGNSNNIPVFIGGEIRRTTDGGINWQRVYLDTNLRVAGFHFLNDLTGYVVGGTYSLAGKICKTTNGGLNWFDVTQPGLDSYFHNIVFIDNNTGYIGGTYGVFKTVNGGANWVKVFDQGTFINLSFNKIAFSDVNTGYYLSDSGKVYKTINAGANWQQVRQGGEDARFFDIKFTSASTGFICGEAGSMYKTSDGGNTWQQVTTGNTNALYSMFFSTPSVGYISGSRFAMKTMNGGQNWSNIFDVNTRSLYSVYFSDINTGYLTSDTGIVYKTTTGGVIGINPISTQIPNDFSLSQNYPNPFNPTTNIKFAVPKASFVRLAVYDMLGREVDALVNEQLSPGTYEVDWNAAKFSSGIYMYKLMTNDFSMVKKMSLIK